MASKRRNDTESAGNEQADGHGRGAGLAQRTLQQGHADEGKDDTGRPPKNFPVSPGDTPLYQRRF